MKYKYCFHPQVESSHKVTIKINDHRSSDAILATTNNYHAKYGYIDRVTHVLALGLDLVGLSRPRCYLWWVRIFAGKGYCGLH